MKVIICTLALGENYVRGVWRMRQTFRSISPGYELQTWVETLPLGSPNNQGEFAAYCAKPFVLGAAKDSGADIGILLDAAFVPIRSIQPLVDFIAERGYYFCDNGFNVGQWSTDRALEMLNFTRKTAFTIPEISSYCVGLDFRVPRSVFLLQDWKTTWPAIPGPHTNENAGDMSMKQREVGFCSSDPRCLGHRHDQTTLSLLAYRAGMLERTPRPIFTAYAGSETEQTVLVNRGCS
jgi:hypothetical protein